MPAPEPPLREITTPTGKMNLAMFIRIIRRVKTLHENVDSYLSPRKFPALPALTEPAEKLVLDSSFLQSLLRKIENAHDEFNAAGFVLPKGVIPEPPLRFDPPPKGLLTIAVINRIIRRIEQGFMYEQTAGYSYSA